MRTRLQWTLLLSIALALAGCNTMRGFGRDVERGGERVQDAAGNVQNRM
jgi:predicted small secreted protein